MENNNTQANTSISDLEVCQENVDHSHRIIAKLLSNSRQ